MSSLISLLKRHKPLMMFVSLNYLDKGIAFLLPLFVLFFAKNVLLYNSIEYVYSIANIIVILLELGGRIYFMYGYSKESEDKDLYVANVRSFYFLLNLVYSLLILCVFLFCRVGEFNLIIYYIGIRSLILMFVNYSSIYYRLIDKPQNTLFFSIIINSLTILIMIVLKYTLTDNDGLFYFFLPSSLFILFLSVLGFKSMRKNIFDFSKIYLIKAIRFSWPIILNILIMTLINNYGKIYIFNRFSGEQMFIFSYLLRISMIVQMAHSSIIAFYAKSIYLDSNEKINFHIYKLYTIFLLLAILFSYILIYAINWLEVLPNIPINFLSIILLLYVFIWCQQSYFEQYLNKKNKNKWVLYISSIGVCIYIYMLFFDPFNIEITINYIAISMLLSILTTSLGMIYCLKKLKLI